MHMFVAIIMVSALARCDVLVEVAIYRMTFDLQYSLNNDHNDLRKWILHKCCRSQIALARCVVGGFVAVLIFKIYVDAHLEY